MKPHPRIRKMIKWTGAVVTVLLVVVWIGSGWWTTYIWSTAASDVTLSRGCLWVHHATVDPSTVVIIRTPGRTPFQMQWGPTRSTRSTGWSVAIPLWVPAAMLLPLVAVAWRLDLLEQRRARIGLCPTCNYDRTGLAVDAKCPECGSRGAVPSS